MTIEEYRDDIANTLVTINTSNGRLVYRWIASVGEVDEVLTSVFEGYNHNEDYWWWLNDDRTLQIFTDTETTSEGYQTLRSGAPFLHYQLVGSDLPKTEADALLKRIIEGQESYTVTPVFLDCGCGCELRGFVGFPCENLTNNLARYRRNRRRITRAARAMAAIRCHKD